MRHFICENCFLREISYIGYPMYERSSVKDIFPHDHEKDYSDLIGLGSPGDFLFAKRGPERPSIAEIMDNF